MPPSPDRNYAAMGGLERRLRRECHLRVQRDRGWLGKVNFVTRSLAVDSKIKCVRVAVAHVAAAPRNDSAPLRILQAGLLPELHVAPPLANARAAHAREIRFS